MLRQSLINDKRGKISKCCATAVWKAAQYVLRTKQSFIAPTEGLKYYTIVLTNLITMNNTIYSSKAKSLENAEL